MRADATCLPFRAGTIRGIYAHHLLEHLRREQARQTVQHWWRLLIPGGFLSLVVPDWKRLFAMQDVPNTAERDKWLFGIDDTRGPYQRHLSAWSSHELEALVMECGFSEVLPIDIATYEPLVARPRWQGGVRAVK